MTASRRAVPWMTASHLTAPWMATYFEQVKECWEKQKAENSLGRKRMPEHFLSCYLVSPALHPGFSYPKRSQTALSSTPIQGYFLKFKCFGIQFFKSHSHVTYETPCHARSHSHSYLEKRRISLEVRGILSMCLCSYT